MELRISSDLNRMSTCRGDGGHSHSGTFGRRNFALSVPLAIPAWRVNQQVHIGKIEKIICDARLTHQPPEQLFSIRPLRIVHGHSVE